MLLPYVGAQAYSWVNVTMGNKRSKYECKFVVKMDNYLANCVGLIS